MKIERLDNWDMKPVTLMLTAENQEDIIDIKKLEMKYTRGYLR